MGWYGATQKIELRLNIRNLTSGELALLTWKLPFGEIEDDIFVVTCGGKRMPYIGRVVRRAAPTVAHYVRIPAGKNFNGTFDLATSYAIDEGGECTAQFKASGVHAKGSDAASGLDPLSGRHTGSGTVTSEPLFLILDPRPRPLEGPLVEMLDGAVVETPDTQSPEDAAAEELLALSPPAEALAEQPLVLTPEEEQELLALLRGDAASQGDAAVDEDPQEASSEDAQGIESLAFTASYRSCSATRQTQVQKALTSAQSYAKGAYSFLSSTRQLGPLHALVRPILLCAPLLREDALLPDEERHGVEALHLRLQLQQSQLVRLYTAPARTRIWLCPLFWKSPNTGRYSKAGTIVHETSHFSIIGNTYDYECKA